VLESCPYTILQIIEESEQHLKMEFVSMRANISFFFYINHDYQL
jgi:hypothetical protein